MTGVKIRIWFFFSLKICFGIFILMTRYEKKNGQKKSLEYFSKTLRQTLDNTLVKTGTMLKWLFHILGGGGGVEDL